MRRASERQYGLIHKVRTSRVRLGIYLAVALVGLTPLGLFGAWKDPTDGQPILENFSAAELGTDAVKWTVLQDKFGRLFVGGDQLHVFDGQAWQAFPVPNAYSLRALVFGEDGKLWTGAINEIGYFEEEGLGNFKYHSLVAHLPKEERLVGNVWGCVPVGRNIYFVCQDRLLYWDGSTFRVWHFIGKTRLFPLKLNDEQWFHHLETGLYRLTDTGPHLEIPATQLPDAGIIGLAKDKDGLLLVSAAGFFRPGVPPKQVFSEELNKYITESKPACFALLPDGSYATGTLNGGIAVVSPAGEFLRILDTTDGLPTRTIVSLSTDAAGTSWATTPDGIFRFEGSGHTTQLGAPSGLKGDGIVDLRHTATRFYTLTLEGVFSLSSTPRKGGQFEQLPHLTEIYSHILPDHDQLFLARHGGLDLYDDNGVRSLLPPEVRTVFFTQSSRTDPAVFFLSEPFGLARMERQLDGSFVHTRFLELSDTCNSLQEDTAGRLWIGTPSKGAFTYDPRTKQITPVNDPTTGTPLIGEVGVAGTAQRILLLLNNRILQVRKDGTRVEPLDGLPVFQVIATQAIPGSPPVLVAFKRPGAKDAAGHGLGLLSLADDGPAQWQELDVPDLNVAGFIRRLEFSEENGRKILWVGGTTGLLRLDFDTLKPRQAPTAPFIRQDPLNSGQLPDAEALAFPFKDHRLKFRIFTGDYARGRDWLFQSRLGDGTGEWSAASSRRLFEYTNLSEGDYRFEVRAVNAAGQASAPAAFTFRILPPWYRSTGAYAGYAAFLLLVVFGFIRVRERRIRARNQELETLVEVRTAELVKASAAKDEFLAGVSHEIRNPMNGVIGIAENFRTEGLDAESRRKFSLLRQCASHLSSLLEDILDFSKVQAGAIELDPKPFDLPELVESVAAITRADSEKYGVPVELAVSPAVPRELVGDARRIRQILINFVSNALKFSGRGQVSVTVWCKSLGLAQTEVIFAVSDEGPGISAEEQTRLFTRFERGAAAQKGRVPGTGLGLALCKGLAEKMGGRIWLESELGQGSCFYFSAPFAVAAAPAEPAAAAPAPAPAGRTALVVDDQEYNRIVLADLLQSMGFTVHTAQEGEAALALAGGQNFDVVFLDFNLPGISGVDVARGIRTLPNASAHALILATTAFTTPEKRAQCRDAGMDAFLGKPVTKERLAKALAGLQPAAAAVAPAAKPSAPPAKGPADRLGNLRLLARKKGVPLAAELALYLSELDTELAQLEAAVTQADATEAGRCAHLLVGRCGFIYEREMEQTQRSLEAAVGGAHWDEARRLLGEFAAQLADLRIRVAASSGPAAPPA